MERRSLLSRLAFLPLAGAAEGVVAAAGEGTRPSGASPPAPPGTALYPLTPAERARGITPVSYDYPELNVMRYGARGDGSTDDAPAFQRALDIAKVSGGTVYIPKPSAHYVIRAPLDLTPSREYSAGFGVRMEANPHFSVNSPRGAILLEHTSIGFDCTGNNALQFTDLCVAARAEQAPTVAFLIARNSSGASVVHRFNNCRVYGHFSIALYYNYGCEDDQLVGCCFYNLSRQANSKTVVITAKNIFGVSSPHAPIYSGSISTSHHHFCGGDYAHTGGRSTSDVFYLDICSFLHLERLWVDCEHGRSIIFCDSTNGPSNNCTIFGMQVENGGAPEVGIAMPSPPRGRPTFVDWVIDACYFANCGIILQAGTAITLASCKLRGVASTFRRGIEISGTAAYCTFDCDATPVNIGLAQQCILMGSVQNFALTTNQRCCFIDARPSRVWEPITANLTVLSGGSIALSAVNSNVIGNQVEVTFTMQPSTAMYCGAGTVVGGLPFPPMSGRGGIVAVTDGTAGVAIGLGHIGEQGIQLPAIASAAAPTSHAICVTARYFIA